MERIYYLFEGKTRINLVWSYFKCYSQNWSSATDMIEWLIDQLWRFFYLYVQVSSSYIKLI